MTAIPHTLVSKWVNAAAAPPSTPSSSAAPAPLLLPPPDQYAVGNVYFKPDESVIHSSKAQFTDIAKALGLTVLYWRPVPRDNSILGPQAKAKEPVILQPIVTLSSWLSTSSKVNKLFNEQKVRELYN